MTSVTIFIKEASPAGDLSTFASQLSNAFENCVLTERESSNYAHGHYFKGSCGGSEITLYYLDTEGLEQYLYAIEIAATREEVAHQAARAIAKAGFSCFVPSGAWYRKSWNGEGKAYEF